MSLNIFTEYNLVSQYLSWVKKKANNFEYAELVADYYDDVYTGEMHDSKKAKFLVNYDLYNGRADMSSMVGGSSYLLDDEEVDLSYENISHHDIISQVAKAMVGEQRKRLLYPTVIDSSTHTVNMRKERKMQLIQDYFEQTVYEPIRQQITEKYFIENGIEDPYALTIEQQQQAQSDIETKVKAMSPTHIEEYMKQYKTPYEIQGQKLLNYLMEDLNIKFVTDEGFKHALITGIECYRLGIQNHSPIYELCNPIGINYGISSDKTFIQDADWVTYEEYCTISDIFNKYGNKLRRKDIEKLEGAASYGSDRLQNIQSNVVWEFAKNPEAYASENIDIRTRQGQSTVRDIHARIQGDTREGDAYKIRVLHVVWKTLRILKYVRRNINGKDQYFYRDESYVKDPLKGDISVSEIFVPEVWQCVKIGEGDSTVYTDKGPIPYQNLSIDDPFNVKLPYYGAEYSRMMGNSENVSIMDLGKPWQYKFNVQMAKIEESEATDLGRIVSMYLHHKPDNYTFQEWFNMMRYSKVLLMNPNKEGNQNTDPQAIRELNLGNERDIQAKIGYLEFLRNQVVYSMMYNPQSLGQIGQYATAYNVQQSQNATSNQTEDIFAFHNQIVQSGLNGIINYARIAYKDNPLSVTYVLSDLDKADLELDTEMLWRSKIGIFVKNTGEDIQNLMQIKSRSQEMIQNGLISFPELIKLQLSRSTAEVYQIAEAAETRRKEAEAQQREEQMIQQREALEAQKAAEERVMAWELKKHEDDMAMKQYYAQQEASKFERMNDVDQNNKSDALESKELEMLAKASMEEKNRKLEEKMHNDKMEIEKLKISAMKKR